MSSFDFSALGPGFEVRWKRASPSLRRDILAELRAIYRFLSEDDDIPMLAPQAPVLQTMAAPSLAPRPDNPFLPKSVLERLRQHPLPQAELPPSRPAPSDSQLEQELRQRLSPVLEQILDEQMHSLRAELRFRLQKEVELLIQERLRARP